MVTRPQDTPERAVTATAGPAEPVPVAVLARTSTLVLQDPLGSLRRQITSCQEWLPPGWRIVAYYWDVESGGIDLEKRSQGRDWEPFVAADMPRDGGMAELLAEAASPLPRFAAVVCEDIERSGRDIFNALKLERELSDQGILLFATDEPATIDGINATTVLVRRVKQASRNGCASRSKRRRGKGLSSTRWTGGTSAPPPTATWPTGCPTPCPSRPRRAAPKPG